MPKQRSGLRESILEAASTLFARFGYRGATLQDIAESVGSSRPALLYHFKSKEALLEELLTPPLRESRTVIESAVSLPDPVQRQDAVIAGVTSLTLKYRNVLKLLTTHVRELNRELPQIQPREFLKGLTAAYYGENPTLGEKLSMMAAISGIVAAAVELPSQGEEEARSLFPRILRGVLQNHETAAIS